MVTIIIRADDISVLIKDKLMGIAVAVRKDLKIRTVGVATYNYPFIREEMPVTGLVYHIHPGVTNAPIDLSVWPFHQS
ncbi:hypothetical protein D9M68_997480 [compost metagenome]